MEKICPYCREKFTTSNICKIYCSAECKIAANNEKARGRKRPEQKKTTLIEKVCVNCGKKFLTTKPNKKLCSDKCAAERSEKQKRLHSSPALKKERKKISAVQRLMKNYHSPTLDESIRRADELGISYGKYKAFLMLGKTFEDLRKQFLNEVTA